MNQIFKISLIILGIALFYVVKSYMVDKFSSTETFFTTEHNKSANSHFQNYAKESGFYVKAETFNKNETDLQNQSELNFREENNIKEEKEVEKISPYDIIYDHLSDKYSWELIGLPIKPLTVYLPVIVGKDFKSLEIFSSKKLQGNEKYHGYFIAREGDYKNKVVYIDESGAEKRPIDISFTKDACALVISSLVMFLVLFSLKRFYKKKPLGVPRGFRGMLESLTMMIVDEVLKPCLRDDYKRYAPYLLTVFYFILTINLLGLIVIFPGGVNLSGNISICMVLAVCTLILTIVSGTKHYWKEIFWPDVPVWLNAPFPMMTIIELFGIFSKPFALMVRMFANLFGGHIIILVLTTLIFLFAPLGVISLSISSVFVVVFSVFMLVIEVLICFIQAYVFTMLSALFIGLSRE